jgi:uncharacterized membrane protein YqjE
MTRTDALYQAIFDFAQNDGAPLSECERIAAYFVDRIEAEVEMAVVEGDE